MKETDELAFLTKKIRESLSQLEGLFWDEYVLPSFADGNNRQNKNSFEYMRSEDQRSFLFYGTRMLYYKVCVFLELKGVPLYREMFVSEFGKIIDNEELVTEQTGGRYSESEPNMKILDRFADFLNPFMEFDNSFSRQIEANKLRKILLNTNNIIRRTNTTVSSEASIYNAVRWLVEIVFPSTAAKNKARFIRKFKKYDPDILIPEIASAVEYKYIRSGEKPGDYIDQLKTDADNYTGDPEYKHFFAVAYFEDKHALNQEAFMYAIKEKGFPDGWDIFAL